MMTTKTAGCKGNCTRLYPISRKGVRGKYHSGLKKCTNCQITVYDVVDATCQCCKRRFRVKSHCKYRWKLEN